MAGYRHGSDFGEIVHAWIKGADEFLLGRTTYDGLFPYWSQVADSDGVVAQRLNNLPKHIVSRTLRSPEWKNSSVIDSDAVEAVKAPKAKPGRDLQVHGSAQRVQTLIQHDLLDE